MKKIELKTKKNDFTKLHKIGGLTVKEKYAQWLAFPAFLRGLNDSQIVSMGIDASDADPLLMIKTKTDFAKVLKISRRQLYFYEKDKEFKEKVKEFEREWSSNRTPNVILSLYRGALKHGDAARVKLWLQLFRGFTDKIENKHTVDLPEIKELTEKIRGFLKD